MAKNIYISTSFRVGVAPERWSKYTAHGVSLTAGKVTIKPGNVAPSATKIIAHDAPFYTMSCPWSSIPHLMDKLCHLIWLILL